MKYELWTLAVDDLTVSRPWVEVYPTHAAALARLAHVYDAALEVHPRVDLTSEDQVRRALNERGIFFSIEPAIIDTDELDEP